MMMLIKLFHKHAIKIMCLLQFLLENPGPDSQRLPSVPYILFLKSVSRYFFHATILSFFIWWGLRSQPLGARFHILNLTSFLLSNFSLYFHISSCISHSTYFLQFLSIYIIPRISSAIHSFFGNFPCALELRNFMMILITLSSSALRKFHKHAIKSRCLSTLSSLLPWLTILSQIRSFTVCLYFHFEKRFYIFLSDDYSLIPLQDDVSVLIHQYSCRNGLISVASRTFLYRLKLSNLLSRKTISSH